jgi:cytochrome c6
MELGKKIFFLNCNVCHQNGTNIIIPEKNLKKEVLDINGMNNLDSIIYQVINGKNGMPAFGGRLSYIEIESVSEYVLEEASRNFEK